MDKLYLNEDITILVIDDNSRNVQIIGTILLSVGYNVSFATSGIEALKIIEGQDSFNLILLDILMPLMDGFEVFKEIKAHEKSADVPIIFLTAKSDKDSVVKGLAMGAKDYIIKPFNDNELLLRVKTQVELQKQREKLEQTNQTLEQMVMEKTAEIQLANKKLSLLEKAKGNFLSLISHELRTPLNIINGFAEILHEALMDSEHINELLSLRESTDRLISLSETALLITEIQLGKYAFEFEKIDLKEACKSAALELKSHHAARVFDYEIETPNQPVIINGDQNLIQNIILKITENSIIATQGKCKITYRITSNEKALRLNIIDNGPGFSKTDLEKLFDVFSKDGPNTEHEGFGLGLAAVNLVMEVHSGSVEVENMREGGAMVSLNFPLNHPQ